MWGFWILVILLLVLIAALPTYPYSREWGYGPSGILVALVILWLVVIWLGAVAFWWPWAPVAAPAA